MFINILAVLGIIETIILIALTVMRCRKVFIFYVNQIEMVAFDINKIRGNLRRLEDK